MTVHREGAFDCAVLIPTHKASCDERELASLEHTLKVLERRDVFVLLPDGVSPAFYRELQSRYANLAVRNLEPGFLGSIENYNAMALSTSFYEAFREYRYLLTCHLDAWIFADDLDRWIESGYDYVGAPLFLPESGRDGRIWKRAAPCGGNGGVSLRRTAKMLELVGGFRKRPNYLLALRGAWWLARNRQWKLLRLYFFICRSILVDVKGFVKQYNVYEDVAISVLYALLDRRLRVAPPRVAARMALEVNAQEICETELDFALPMAVHGVGTHISLDAFEWMLAKARLRDETAIADQPRRSAESDPPVVTVITIIKDIVKGGRTDVFRQSVESVRRQTYARIEHLIVDGASTDGTLELLEEYRNDPRIRIHSSPDKGIWDAMEKGVRLASGEFINLMNSDDYFCNDGAVEIAVAAMRKSRADWFYSGATIILRDGTHMPFPTSLYGVFACIGIVHQTIFVRRSLIIESAAFSSRHRTRENYFMMLLILNGFKPACSEKSLVHYREGGFSFHEYGGANVEGTKQDFADYFHRIAGRRWGLSIDDCREMFGWQIFGTRGLKRSITVGSKLGLFRLKVDFFRRLAGFGRHHRGTKNVLRAVARRMAGKTPG